MSHASGLRLFALSLLTISAAPAPRHLLRLDGALTEAASGPAREIGRAFTEARMAAIGLPPGAPGGVYLAQEYQSAHNGVTHLVYRQRFQGLDVYGMEWRVNIDSQGRVLNAGGDLFTPPAGHAPDGAQLASAARAAVSALDPIRAREFTVRRAGLSRRGDARFVTEDLGEITGRPVWYPVHGVLQPAWRFLVTDPDGVTTTDVVLEPNSESILARRSLTMFQNPARGAVFTGISPQPAVKPGVQSNEEPPFVERVLVPFPAAWLSGNETAGNNTITGRNLAGTPFLPNPLTARSDTRDFQFPLSLGPGSPPSSLFGDAVTTNLFYWVNRAHDLFADAGFDEAAGNFQARNRTGFGTDGDPMLAYSHFGAQSLTGLATLNNAFFTTLDPSDGAQSMIAMFLTSVGGAWADGGLAADVIVHEYAHGVTTRLVPTMHAGYQGSSMHEGLSDFWALELLTPEGAPADGVYPTGEYPFRAFGTGLRSRPLSTNLEINPLTFRDLGRVVYFSEIHEDGQIFAVTLWDVRANLIRQFGETEGRKRLRRLVIDGLKLAPPAPSMLDLRDAILLADRVTFNGASQSSLWEAFAKRGMGVLAQSPNSDSIQVVPSSDLPSPTGQIAVSASPIFIGERVRITVSDANYAGATMTVDVTASSGDTETVVLDRNGSIYTGNLVTTSGNSAPRTGALSLIAGDAVTIYYNDANTGAGARQIEKTVPVALAYTATFSSAPAPFNFPNETATNLRSANPLNFVRVALPFEFPFYGKKYREMFVFAGGYVQFDTTLPELCVDEYNLGKYPLIAPLAMWMRTNGTTQPAQNIYVSRGPNSYTVRWAGETVPLVNAPPFTAPPEPVNVALTLQENGLIRFLYGPGNQSLITRAPVGGCIGTAPVVGISRGLGTPLTANPYGYERVNFNGAPALGFIPPFENASVPQAVVESPAPDARVQGVLHIRGYIYDTDTAVIGSYILIDGRYFGNVNRGQARPDLCAGASRLPGCPSIGFVANLDLKALGIKPGSHTLQIRAANAKGGFADYPESPLPFTVEEGDGALPVAVINGLASGDVWKDTVTLRGSAYGKSTRVIAVDLLVDGIVYNRALHGLPNPDLCRGDAAGSPNCPSPDWFIQVATAAASPAFTNGEHQVQLRLTEESDRLSLHPAEPLRVTVENTPRQSPMGVVTAPKNLERVSGVIQISGYAWDPDGRIATATLVVDGVSRGAIRYGVPAPEACAQRTDIPACPNIGFEGTLDTRLLPNGAHTLGVNLIDNAGNAKRIPAITLNGLNLLVANE